MQGHHRPGKSGRTHFHPVQQLAPAALNAGSALRLRPFILGGQAAGLDPLETFMPAPPGEQRRWKADDQVPCE
jgi:hypothetical protein